MKQRWPAALTGLLLAALTASGCGLKGALTLPSKSDEVVIRAPGQAVPVEGEPAAAPTTPSGQPKSGPTPPKDDRMPPPPLPGGNSGTARGG